MLARVAAATRMCAEAKATCPYPHLVLCNPQDSGAVWDGQLAAACMPQQGRKDRVRVLPRASPESSKEVLQHSFEICTESCQARHCWLRVAPTG